MSECHILDDLELKLIDLINAGDRLKWALIKPEEAGDIESIVAEWDRARDA